MNSKHQALLALLIAALLGGGSSTMAKLGVQSIPPLTFSFIRFALASVIIVPLFLKQTRSFTWRRKHWQLIGVSLLATLNFIVFIFGVGRTTAIAAQMLYTGTPLLTGILAHFFFHQILSLRKLLGIVLGLFGTAIVLLLPILGRGQPFSGDLLGNLLIASGVVIWAVYNLQASKLHQSFSILTITTALIVVSALVTLPLSFLESKNWLTNLTPKPIFALLYLAILGTVGYYLILQRVIRLGGALVSTMMLYLAPLFAFGFASVFLGEALTPGFALGTLLAFAGVALATTDNHTV